MIAQWENEYISLCLLSMALVRNCISPPVLFMARIQFPAVAEYFKGLSLDDHTPFHVRRSGNTKG